MAAPGEPTPDVANCSTEQWLVFTETTAGSSPEAVRNIEDSIRRITGTEGPIANYTSKTAKVGRILWYLPKLSVAQKRDIEAIPGVAAVTQDGESPDFVYD
nr:hypothetical protein B0A51_02216 [Rachicladosporium sp. CCFEE 5018]